VVGAVAVVMSTVTTAAQVADGTGDPARHPFCSAAYKQLLAVERGWRDMKDALGLRPVFHYREDRIRAHVQLCWLALLLIRVMENTTGVDDLGGLDLDPMHLVALATPDGKVAQRSTLTAGQKTILDGLKLPEPPRFFDFTIPTG